MEIIILGSGSAYGTPMMGGFSHGCDMGDKRNIRFRSSVLIKENGGNILIDVTPDIRLQTLENNVSEIDAVLLTHGHADHIAGLWELPRYSYNSGKSIDMFASEYTMSFVHRMFDFMFSANSAHPVKDAQLSWHDIKHLQPFECCGCEILPIDFPHNGINKEVITTGYLINKKVLYSTDISGVFDKNANVLMDLDCWIIDCNNGTRDRENGHLCLDEILNFKQKFKPKKIYLTHIQDDMDFALFSKNLPDDIEMTYDGMIIKV